jgi:plasmid maintenance system antidote protein VapI
MVRRKKEPKTMTELLRQALREAESLNAIQKATGVKRQSMAKFMREEQTMRLDLAERLAEYFGLECRRTR